MVNYTNSKVYKIWSTQGDKIYVGSTTKQYWSQRMDKHRTEYKYWKTKQITYMSSFIFLDLKYGSSLTSFVKELVSLNHLPISSIVKNARIAGRKFALEFASLLYLFSAQFTSGCTRKLCKFLLSGLLGYPLWVYLLCWLQGQSCLVRFYLRGERWRFWVCLALSHAILYAWIG